MKDIDKVSLTDGLVSGLADLIGSMALILLLLASPVIIMALIVAIFN